MEELAIFRLYCCDIQKVKSSVEEKEEKGKRGNHY